MNTYLTIITTALVLTQIIRLIQNAINLHMQNKEIKTHLNWLDRNEVTEEDFKVQREVFRMLHKYLKGKNSDKKGL